MSQGKKLAIYFCLIFLSLNTYSSSLCEKSLLSKKYEKYDKKYADNFEIFLSNENIIWQLNGNWFSFKDKTFDSCHLIKNRVPEKVVLMSSTLLEAFIELRIEKTIVGISEKRYIFNADKKIKNAIDLGTIPSIENIISLKPDLVFGYSSPILESFYDKIQSLGIKVVFIDDFGQDHPLARAEQRLIIGAFYNKFYESKKHYDSVLSSYMNLKKQVERKVHVLLGRQNASGAWKNLDQKSDFYQIIKDAGGVDVLSFFTSSLVSPEEILNILPKIDFWLPQFPYRSIREIKNESNFLKILIENSTFKISSYGKNLNNFGGSEFWDVAIMRPDLFLEDLITVLGTSKLNNLESTHWYRFLR